MDNIARASVCDGGGASRGGVSLHLPLHLPGPDLHQVCQVSGLKPGKGVNTLRSVLRQENESILEYNL